MIFAPAAWALANIVSSAESMCGLAASTLMVWSCVGKKPRTWEPQSTPAFEPMRIWLRVCAPALRSCLTHFVLFAAPLDDERPPPPAQLQIGPHVAGRVALVNPEHLQLLQKGMLELVRAVDEDF